MRAMFQVIFLFQFILREYRWWPNWMSYWTSISAGPLSVQTRREFFLKERISKGPLLSERLSSYFNNIQKMNTR